MHSMPPQILIVFFFNDTATTEIYTLSLHDALPISRRPRTGRGATPRGAGGRRQLRRSGAPRPRDRKSTRLNSSHSQISYAVFCLKINNPQLVAAAVVPVVLHAVILREV